MASSPNAPGSHSHTSISTVNPPPPAHTNQGLEIPLETLVSHLLASKRSLSSISTVWRANEIVTSAKNALEESAILQAKTRFLQSGINEQMKTLLKVRKTVEFVYNDGQEDFSVSHRTKAAMCGVDHNMRRTFYIISMPQMLGLNLR